jgi:transposase
VLRNGFDEWLGPFLLLRKEIGQTKNRVHSLLKENLFPFTKEYIFGKGSRQRIRSISSDPVLNFQINLLMDTLERLEAQVEEVMDMIKVKAEPFMREIEILTSMTGVSLMSAIAIIADVIEVSRFKNTKHADLWSDASYLSSAPRVESSNNTTVIKSTNKAGRKVSITIGVYLRGEEC